MKGSGATLPYELALDVLLQVEDFNTLNTMCRTSSWFTDICKQNKTKLIASVVMKK